MVGKEQVVSGPFAGLVEQEHSMPLGSTTFSPSLKIWPDSVMQFGPVEHRGMVMTTTTTPTPKASDDVTDHAHQKTTTNKRYRYDRCYMGPNVTLMTGVTWA